MEGKQNKNKKTAKKWGGVKKNKSNDRNKKQEKQRKKKEVKK